MGSTPVTSTAAEINLIDGGTSRGTIAVADGDGILINDGGTMRMTTVQTVSTYMAAESVGGGNMVTVGALNSGSITSGFGNIDNGTSNITSGGILTVDVDATGTGAGLAGASGTLNLGASNDLNIYHDSANSFIVHNNTGDLVVETTAGGIILDPQDATLDIKYTGTLGATFSGTGLNIASGDAYYIDDTSVLNATTLGTNVVTSSLTTVGALGSGSIATGFGAIDNGSSAITTTGTVTYGTLNDGTTSLTATVAELNAAADTDTRVENVTSTNSITAAETGKTFFLNSGTEFESTLPAPAAGLEYTFIVKAAPSGASYEIKTNGDTDILIGLVTCATADDLGATDNDADVISFVGGSAVVGDWVRVVSDGTSWYFSGACKVAEAITTATS